MQYRHIIVAMSHVAVAATIKHITNYKDTTAGRRNRKVTC